MRSTQTRKRLACVAVPILAVVLLWLNHDISRNMLAFPNIGHNFQLEVDDGYRFGVTNFAAIEPRIEDRWFELDAKHREIRSAEKPVDDWNREFKWEGADYRVTARESNPTTNRWTPVVYDVVATEASGQVRRYSKQPGDFAAATGAFHSFIAGRYRIDTQGSQLNISDLSEDSNQASAHSIAPATVMVDHVGLATNHFMARSRVPDKTGGQASAPQASPPRMIDVLQVYEIESVDQIRLVNQWPICDYNTLPWCSYGITVDHQFVVTLTPSRKSVELQRIGTGERGRSIDCPLPNIGPATPLQANRLNSTDFIALGSQPCACFSLYDLSWHLIGADVVHVEGIDDQQSRYRLIYTNRSENGGAPTTIQFYDEKERELLGEISAPQTYCRIRTVSEKVEVFEASRFFQLKTYDQNTGELLHRVAPRSWIMPASVALVVGVLVWMVLLAWIPANHTLQWIKPLLVAGLVNALVLTWACDYRYQSHPDDHILGLSQSVWIATGIYAAFASVFALQHWTSRLVVAIGFATCVLASLAITLSADAMMVWWGFVTTVIPVALAGVGIWIASACGMRVVDHSNGIGEREQNECDAAPGIPHAGEIRHRSAFSMRQALILTTAIAILFAVAKPYLPDLDAILSVQLDYTTIGLGLVLCPLLFWIALSSWRVLSAFGGIIVILGCAILTIESLLAFDAGNLDAVSLFASPNHRILVCCILVTTALLLMLRSSGVTWAKSKKLFL